jgi:putative membrane protein
MAERSSVAVILVIVLLFIGLLFLLPMFGGWMWGPVMMGGGMMGRWGYPLRTGWGFMFAGILIPILFIVLLVVGAYLLISPRREPIESEKAIAILNERYAKGEITKEQYLEMKQQLTKR